METYLLSFLRNTTEQEGLLMLMTANTGTAAALYERRRTLHSLIGLGFDDNKNWQSREPWRLSKYKPRLRKAELFRRTVLVVVDEASMCPNMLLEPEVNAVRQVHLN